MGQIRRRCALVAVAVAGVLLVGCGSTADSPTGEAGTTTSPTASPTPTEESSEPAAEPAAALPKARSVRQLGGETIRATPFADFAVAAAGGIWVSGVAPGLVRYDAATGRITHEVSLVSEVGQALDAAGGSVWVVGSYPDLLLEVDERTGKVRSRVPLPASPLTESSPATDGQTAWVLVDPLEPRFAVVSGGRVAAEVPAPADALAARYADGSLWVTTSSDTLVRVDPETGEVLDSVAVGAGSRFLAVGDGAVWVMSSGVASATRVSTADLAVETTVAAGEPISGGDIAVDEGAVWLRTSTGATRVDPDTLRPTDRISLDWGSGSIAAANGWLWLTDHDHDAVHRVPLPLRDG